MKTRVKRRGEKGRSHNESWKLRTGFGSLKVARRRRVASQRRETLSWHVHSVLGQHLATILFPVNSRPETAASQRIGDEEGVSLAACLKRFRFVAIGNAEGNRGATKRNGAAGR